MNLIFERIAVLHREFPKPLYVFGVCFGEPRQEITKDGKYFYLIGIA